MRFRYFRALDGLKVCSIFLVLCIIPAISDGCRGSWRQGLVAARPNVTFQGQALGGLLPQEVYVVVERLATDLQMAPLEAAPDQETGGVIPELNGYQVNVEETVSAILAARSGTQVAPVFREVPSAVTLAAFPERAIYRGRPERGQVAFLVNVAWGNEYLPELLQALREVEAGATFFLVGRWVRQHPDLAVAIREAGFELANHGYSDAVSLGRVGVSDVREEIAKGAATIKAVCGVYPTYFSPHKGELTEKVLQAASLENSRVIMWTVDTVDWKLPGVEKMVQKVLAKAEGGSMVLMHPTAQTAEFVRLTVPALRKSGLHPVSVSELLCPSRIPRSAGAMR